MTEAITKPSAEKQWFGHPRQLSLLFTSEMWERFGYYGMRAILVLYLVEHFVFSDRTANGLYGGFTALVYLTPLVGGFVADQYFGSKKSVRFGAILMSIGYFMLAFTGGAPAKPTLDFDGRKYAIEADAADCVQHVFGFCTRRDQPQKYIVDAGGRHAFSVESDGSLAIGEPAAVAGALPANLPASSFAFGGERSPANVLLLLISLATVCVGNGFFKPNISTIVGSLYPVGDRRRDAGFTIFYMGINLGSILSQSLAPLLVVATGQYKWGFALAAVGMALAWARFQLAGAGLKGYGDPPEGANKRDFLVIGGAILAIPLAAFLLNGVVVSTSAANQTEAAGIVGFFLGLPLMGKVMVATFILSFVGVGVYSLSLKAAARDMMLVALSLMVFNVVFWTLFEQAGSSMTLFAARNTDLQIGSYSMPPGMTQIFNPLFIVFLAPVLTIIWGWLNTLNAEPSIPLKFALGLAQVGAGFLILVFGAQFADPETARVAIIWLVLAYLLHSTGELCLSPVGLSMVTKLAVPKLVGMMMGMWFLSIAMAQYAAGAVAQFTSSETVGGAVLDPHASLATYVGVFKTIGLFGIAAGAVLFVLWPLLKKGMHGVK